MTPPELTLAVLPNPVPILLVFWFVQVVIRLMSEWF